LINKGIALVEAIYDPVADMHAINVNPLSEEKLNYVVNGELSITVELEGTPYMLLVEWVKPGRLICCISKIDREEGPLVDYVKGLDID